MEVPPHPQHKPVRGKKSVLRPVRSSCLPLNAFLDEFTGSARFKSPLGWPEKAMLKLAKYVGRFPLFANVDVLSPYSIPAHWQILLNYLSQEEMTGVREITFSPRANDLPRSYSVMLALPFEGEEDSRWRVYGYGNALNGEESFGKAVGETLERHILTLHKDSALVHGSYDMLHRQHKNPLNINHFNTYAAWQKERDEKFNADGKTLSWVWGTELLSGDMALIPAQCVFRRYRSKYKPEEPILMDSTTNGGAGNFTFEEAVLSAIYELVERDAFFMYWLNTLSPPVIDLQAMPPQSVAHSIEEQCKQYGLDVYFLDTTSDIPIPSCICALVDSRGDEPRVTIGGSNGFDIEKNLSSSFFEALSVSNGALDLARFDIPADYKPFSGNPPVGKMERISFWKGSRALDRFSFFISGEKVPVHESSFYRLARDFESVAKEYEYVREIFREKGEGYEVYCYKAAHPVLNRVGYTVVKVVIPKLFPLYLRERLATLDSPRLREAATRQGTREPSLNPWPHPFS